MSDDLDQQLWDLAVANRILEREGVVDAYGHVHGARGLMVSDASLFPGPIGVNPAETILALSTRNAHHLLENRRRYLG